jgi:acyl dehydratase
MSESPKPQLLHTEDLAVGDTYSLGHHVADRDEMVDFARQWDPQQFHIDDTGAATNIFGDVIASGAYTFAVYQRLTVLSVYRHWAVVAGRSLRDVQLPQPVRPGTTLTGELRITDIHTPRRGRALVTTLGCLVADGSEVLSAEIDLYVRSRDTSADGS